MLTDTQISPVDVQSRKDLKLRSGDSVRVWQKIVEKNKIRLQAFDGVVIARKHGTEPGATFTVRRVGSDGIGVEKIFPLYSPMIDKIELVRKTKVRRSRLYFLREKTSRQIREKLRRFVAVNVSTISETEKAKQKVEKEKKVEDAQTEVTASEVEEKKFEDTKTEVTASEVEEEKVEEVKNKKDEVVEVRTTEGENENVENKEDTEVKEETDKKEIENKTETS